jgi:hypothetical protein
VKDPSSEVKNPSSEVKNPSSEMKDPSSEVKNKSPAHLKLAKIATAVKRKAIRSLFSIIIRKMRIVMTLSKFRRTEGAVANAEVVEVAVVAEVTVDSTVKKTMSSAEVAIDPSLPMIKRNQRVKALRCRHQQQQLLHQRRRKLRLRFLPRNSLAGSLLFSEEIAEIDHQAFFSNKSTLNTLNI